VAGRGKKENENAERTRSNRGAIKAPARSIGSFTDWAKAYVRMGMSDNQVNLGAYRTSKLKVLSTLLPECDIPRNVDDCGRDCNQENC
jgi:hypothetical protein